MPLRVRDEEGHSPLRHLRHMRHPWVAFLILPVFAFVNTGVPFAGVSVASILEPVTLGIALGPFVGKQTGVLGPLWLAI